MPPATSSRGRRPISARGWPSATLAPAQPSTTFRKGSDPHPSPQLNPQPPSEKGQTLIPTAQPSTTLRKGSDPHPRTLRLSARHTSSSTIQNASRLEAELFGPVQLAY